MVIRVVHYGSGNISAIKDYLERNIQNEGIYKRRIRKQDENCKRDKIEGFYWWESRFEHWVRLEPSLVVNKKGHHSGEQDEHYLK